MKITKEWLKGKWACKEGFDWWEKHAEANVKKLALRLVKENHFDWANWMLTRIFDKTQNIKYAIFAAEQVVIGCIHAGIVVTILVQIAL